MPGLTFGYIFYRKGRLLGLLPLLGSFLATFLLPQVIVTGLYAEINDTKAFILENNNVTNLFSTIYNYIQRPLKRARHTTISVKIMLILTPLDANDTQVLVRRKTPQTNQTNKIYCLNLRFSIATLQSNLLIKVTYALLTKGCLHATYNL